MHVEKDGQKLDTLYKMCETVAFTQVVIFYKTRKKIGWLMEQLIAREFAVLALLGDTDPQRHEVIMKNSSSRPSRILITTDLLTRDFDIQQVSLIINYDLLGQKQVLCSSPSPFRTQW